jgi:hypothetical protein
VIVCRRHGVSGGRPRRQSLADPYDCRATLIVFCCVSAHWCFGLHCVNAIDHVTSQASGAEGGPNVILSRQSAVHLPSACLRLGLQERALWVLGVLCLETLQLESAACCRAWPISLRLDLVA